MKSRFVLLWAVLFLFVCSVPSFAGGGFALPGVGSKALNMGGAFRGLADDWSAAFWNPAGLAYLPNSEFTMNLYTLNFRPEYTPDFAMGESGYSYSFGYPDETYYPEDRAFFLPSFSRFHKFAQYGGFTGGVAFYVPYKLESRWNLYKPPAGYDNNVPYPRFDHVTDILIWDLHPTVAKTFMEDKLALGFGLSIQRADFDLRRPVLVRTPPGYTRPYDFFPVDARMDSVDGWGFGFNAGILYKVSPKFQLGFSYRSPVDIDLQGDLELEMYLPMIPGSEIEGGTIYYRDGDFQTTLPLPGEIGVGVMYRPTEKLTLTSDVSSVNWSRLEFLDTKDYTLAAGELDTLYALVRETEFPFNWDNIVRFSLGGEYILKENLFLRGGYFFEQSPVPDETFTLLIPDVGDKHSFNLGLSYRIDSFEFGYDYQLVTHKKREVTALEDANGDGSFDNMPGTYKMLFHCSGLSFTYLF
ncbi:MAG: outer membrane protein transport protein [Candidatus Zixiibacteriota bacterium]